MNFFTPSKIIGLFLIILGLNFVWEIFQMPLYKNHSIGFFDTALIHLWASLGELLIFVIIYLLGLMAFRNRTWFSQKKYSPFILFVICGFFIAIIIEKYALATGRWYYDKSMPIIPFIRVGLTPILQMIILPAIIIKIARKSSQQK